MAIRQRIFKWSIVLSSLFAFQTLTYLTIGPALLKSKLLPDYFTSLAHNSDSVFVQDFYVTDCPVGTNTYTSHNLKEDPQLIKQKFNVHYVHFDTPENFSWSDSTHRNYNLAYYTWVATPDWPALLWSFKADQSEILRTNNTNLYKRVVTYHWFLFFWIPTFEFLESTNIEA